MACAVPVRRSDRARTWTRPAQAAPLDTPLIRKPGARGGRRLREFFDRMLGKPPVAVDTTVTKVDIGQLYLQAVKEANRPPIDVTPNPQADEPEADGTTDQADEAW
jgi:hypothetical protein